MVAQHRVKQQNPSMEELKETASNLVVKGKGLLASDESVGTIGKRIEKAGLANTQENRRSYRENFYTASIGNSISGVILFKEALVQDASDGTSFVECLTRQGVLPGVKADEGLTPFEGHEGETVTKGLDTLESSCQQYHRQGAKFTKWRAALKVSDTLPSQDAIEQNAHQLAEYAAICQACHLVPIVEPEVCIDGDHTMERFAVVSEQMIIPGAEYTGPKPTPQQIAQQTYDTMQRTVPAQIPGIVFLSGGQTEEEATVNLNAINQYAQQQNHTTWSLTFSYGRGLQASVMSIWSKDQSKKAEAKAMAAALAAVNASACQGKYHGPHPSILKGSLHESFRGWNANVKSS